MEKGKRKFPAALNPTIIRIFLGNCTRSRNYAPRSRSSIIQIPLQKKKKKEKHAF